jgi:hypothetical protein
MSVKVMGQIYERELNPVEQLVLLSLGDHAQHDGTGIRPSVALTAWKTGLSERTVQRVVRKMRRRGVLVEAKPAGRHRPTEYRMRLEVLPRKLPLRPSDEKGDAAPPISEVGVTAPAPRGDARDARGDTRGARGDTAVAPEPSYEPSGESSRKSSREDDDGIPKDVVVALALAELRDLKDYPFDQAVDARELERFYAKRPQVALVAEIQRWSTRRDHLRHQRRALVAWLKAANDAPPSARENYCTAEGCRDRAYGAARLCMRHRRILEATA